jgi:hypothetical protein
MTDTEIVNWLEGNLDDLTVLRNVSARKRVQLSFCHPATGCLVEIKGKTIREAVETARKAAARV